RASQLWRAPGLSRSSSGCAFPSDVTRPGRSWDPSSFRTRPGVPRRGPGRNAGDGALLARLLLGARDPQSGGAAAVAPRLLPLDTSPGRAWVIETGWPAGGGPAECVLAAGGDAAAGLRGRRR